MRTLLASALCAAAIAAACSTGALAQARSASQSPEEILSDGLDALEDNQTALARKLFEHLMSSYPGTVEAGRAALELEVMGGEGVAAGDETAPGAAPRGVPASTGRIAEIRREFLLNVGDRVFFAESSADIGGRARAVLDHQARWLKKHESLIVTVIGRADDGGSSRDAADLSMQRAEAVRARLIAGGVESNRILIEARGDRDPLALCRSAMCQAQNRHAETMIGDPKQAGEPGRITR